MSRMLLRSGFVLILLALLGGLVVPQLANPRLGLAAHLVGLVGGVLLIVLGLVAPLLELGARAAAVFGWSWLYAAYANWLACLLGAVTGASRFTPIAGAGTSGGPVSESLVAFLLATLSLAALLGAALGVWGLTGDRRRSPGGG